MRLEIHKDATRCFEQIQLFNSPLPPISQTIKESQAKLMVK